MHMIKKNSEQHSHDHSSDHDHDHSESHHPHGSHHHASDRMGWALVLNLSFAIIEFIGGYLTNSVAILSDAIHDFGDALAILIAIGLEKISHRKSTEKFTYGFQRFSVLGALITGVVLLVGSAFVLGQAIPRLWNPVQPNSDGMLLLALLGVAINGWAAYKVSKGSSLNERMIMLHMLEDLFGWILVFLGATVMKFWDIPILDPILAIMLSIWVLINVFRNLREAMKVFLMGSPDPVLTKKVFDRLISFPEICGVHHTHIWSLDGEKHIFTGHLVFHSGATHTEVEQVKASVKIALREFGILEATLEVEYEDAPCSDPQHQS